MDANERRARVTQEAAEWWHRLGTRQPAEISLADREQFTQWLRESPLHVAELLHVAHVHDALERFKLWSEVETLDACDEDSSVIRLSEFKQNEDTEAAQRWREPEEGGRPGLRTLAVAFVTTLVVIAAGWLAIGARGEIIESERAERRQVMLGDGTVVQIEPESLLRVKLEKSERRVTLERGRALFRVAKDPRRPFLVRADRTWVRAVGTSFGVERRHRDIVVTVAEGKVAVVAGIDAPSATKSGATSTQLPSAETSSAPARETAESARSPSTLLMAGQQLTVRRSGSVGPVRSVDTARALAWAQGRLVFENDSLADVVAEFNHYNRTQLRIADSQLADRRVSGVFEANDIETLLAFVQAGTQVSIVRGTEEITFIAYDAR